MTSSLYSYETIYGVITKILHLPANLRVETDGIWRDYPIVLLIPGNPGEIQYYEGFLQKIYERFEEQVEVYGVSHAGHHSLQEGTHPSLEGNPQLYDVQAQIIHKMEFIRDVIGYEREIILIGHSIGAHIAMQLIKRQPQLKCEKAILLFPTVERMISTDAAQNMIKTINRWHWGLLLALNLIHFTPKSFKTWLCTKFWTENHIGLATSSFLDKHALLSSWFMAQDEFEKVQQRDDAFLKRSWRMLTFYYGKNDHWCPLQYFEEMKKDYPQADITLCEENVEHAFVMDEKSVDHMAAFVAEKCKGVL